jgi:YidC/Oxa1 family membrane protein insertase
MDFIAQPMGQLLNFIYNSLAFKSYGIAIIIFTIIIRVILLPLMIKQSRSMAKMQELNPKIQELQKRYKNDKEKLNVELMNVYKENNVNPAGGCLPLLIQLPILFALWQVISRPLTYMLDLRDKIDPLLKALNLPAKNSGAYPEINIINNFDASSVSNVVSGDIANNISQMKDGFNFLGMNLANIPNAALSNFKPEYLILLLIPLIAVTTTYISSKISIPKTSQAQNNSMQKSMLFIGPLMTLIFSFNFPAGMGLYWITGNIFQIFQQLFINKMILNKKEVQDK